MEKSVYNPKLNSLFQARSKLKKLIDFEFKNSFRSDKPIAFLLSGGIDSSIISSIVSRKKIKAKFYSFKSKSKNYDETNNINILKEKYKLNHKFITSNKSNNFKMLKNFIANFGFPLMSSTYLAYGSLCKEISKDNYKVIISGNGGDEIFEWILRSSYELFIIY